MVPPFLTYEPDVREWSASPTGNRWIRGGMWLNAVLDTVDYIRKSAACAGIRTTNHRRQAHIPASASQNIICLQWSKNCWRIEIFLYQPWRSGQKHLRNASAPLPYYNCKVPEDSNFHNVCQNNILVKHRCRRQFINWIASWIGLQSRRLQLEDLPFQPPVWNQGTWSGFRRWHKH